MPGPIIPIVCIIPIAFMTDMLRIVLIMPFMSFIMPIIGVPPCGALFSGRLAAGVGFAGTGLILRHRTGDANSARLGLTPKSKL